MSRGPVMIRRHLARNAVAYLALAVATSGTAYAAATIASPQVVNNSLKSIDLRDGAAVKGADVVAGTLTGADVKADTLTGAKVKEQSLREVPRATLAGRRIDYGRVVAATGVDQRVLLAFRGIELRATCRGNSGGVLDLQVRSTNANTALDLLAHAGSTSDNLISHSFQSGRWLSTSGADVGVWKDLAPGVIHGQRVFLDLYLQWAGGTMTAHAVAKVFTNPNSTSTCFVAGTANSGA